MGINSFSFRKKIQKQKAEKKQRNKAKKK